MLAAARKEVSSQAVSLIILLYSRLFLSLKSFKLALLKSHQLANLPSLQT